LSSPTRIGLYGGTFDPIHQGHLHLIEQLFARDVVDELVLVPAGNPWLRDHAPFASAQDRLAMAQLAVNELPEIIRSHVLVSDVEVNRSGPTYTIDTVEELKKFRPEARWLLILGSDVYANIDKWHRAKELQGLVETLVIARDGEGLNIEALPVSASQIRSQIQNHERTIKYLPESVWAYIQERNLYVRN
jgi:nicotinate-nucleotide adenylyltransferase